MSAKVIDLPSVLKSKTNQIEMQKIKTHINKLCIYQNGPYANIPIDYLKSMVDHIDRLEADIADLKDAKGGTNE